MNGRKHNGRPRRRDWPAAAFAHLELRPKQGLCGCGAEEDQDFRLDEAGLFLEPWQAGPDVPQVRLLMDAALPPRLPAEVLDDVGHEDIPPIETGAFQRVVQYAPGGSDERPTLDVFAVTRLFADEHDARARRALAEDGLRRIPVQLAARAGCSFRADRLER